TRRVRPHEQTHSAPKADRLALLRATAANLESIFLLAPDPDRLLAQALVKRASGVPAGRAELDGVGIRLWVVSGDEAAELARLAGRAQLYIADGHHRYETAAAYAREQPRADRVLSFIVSAADPASPSSLRTASSSGRGAMPPNWSPLGGSGSRSGESRPAMTGWGGSRSRGGS